MSVQGLPPLDNLSVLTLYGEDQGALKKALEHVLSEIVPTARDFNLSTYRADKDDWHAIIAALHQSPMMSPRRAVVVENIDKLKAADSDHLLRYLAAPVSSTLLCLVGSKLDQRSKWAKALKKAGAQLSFDPPKPRDLPHWLQAEARSKGIDIDLNAAGLIVELVGHHPDLLRSNLTLLQTYAGESTQITTHDVEGLLANTREASVFELVDAVARKNLFKAVQLLRGSLARGESPIMILNLLIRHYRQLAKCQALMNSSVPDSEWARRIGIPPFGLRKIQEQARTLHPNRVLDQLIAMYDAETDLKRRSHERDSIIEHIITGLI